MSQATPSATPKHALPQTQPKDGPRPKRRQLEGHRSAEQPSDNFSEPEHTEEELNEPDQERLDHALAHVPLVDALGGLSPDDVRPRTARNLFPRPPAVEDEPPPAVADPPPEGDAVYEESDEETEPAVGEFYVAILGAAERTAARNTMTKKGRDPEAFEVLTGLVPQPVTGTCHRLEVVPGLVRQRQRSPF
jgi:hypothetical protein